MAKNKNQRAAAKSTAAVERAQRPRSHDAEQQLATAKAHFLITFGSWCGAGFFAICVAVPLWVARPAIHDLAGQDTRVNVSLTFSMVWSAASTVAWCVSSRKRKAQSKELVRMRDRLADLETRRAPGEETTG